ncbi:MAG: hypothetical protein Q7U57_13355 [Methylovulum sp.]|nr:hypothetical protein [Methylovulum sp.]
MQNAIIGSPNSASSLMFQQDFDMSGQSMSLDDAEETSGSASLEKGSYQQDVELKTHPSQALEESQLGDTVYRTGKDSGRFLTMGYPGKSANDYRFLATNGIPSELSLKAADTSTLSGLYTSGLGASYSGIGTSDAITLPLDTKIKLGNGYVLSLNLPLSYIENNNTTNFNNAGTSTSYYSASLGAGLTIPLSHLLSMKDVWALTVLSRVGGIDSDSNKDTASAIIYSAGILSQYDMRLAGGVFGIKNMLSYYGTSAQRDQVFKSFDLNGNPVFGSQTDNIDVGVFRNGVYYSHYLGPSLFGRKLSGTVFFTDTRFSTADQYAALYMDSMQQVGFNLALATKSSRTGSFVRRTIDAQDMRIGMTYTTSDLPQNKTVNIDGFGVNFGFNF